jgi:hypothetical protein
VARKAGSDTNLGLNWNRALLRLGGEVLAVLRGGSGALLRDSGERLGEVGVERLIEAAEEWLMPSSKAIQQLRLHVHDATGRVRTALGPQVHWTPAEVEQAFTRSFDAVAHGRSVDRETVADVVLLRELVHHGDLAGISME